MVSLQRRQLLIAGLASPALAPLAGWSFELPGRLVLSGRVVGRDSKPLAGSTFRIGKERVTTDADGRFVLVTDTHAVPDHVSNARRDGEGTWRATFSLALT